MAETKTAIANRPVWTDLSSPDAEASRKFYSAVFGWNVEVNPDPQYGGYGMAKVGDQQVAGIGPKMAADAPTAWSVYIGTDNIDNLAKQVSAAGGKVVAEPFDVGTQGRMGAFQDPSGAVISAWQPGAMSGIFPVNEANTFGWAELNARGVDKALPFYKKLFGWSVRTSPTGPDGPPYNEFLLGGESIAGAQEMQPMVPKEVPSYWLVYFSVDDVDKTFKKATDAGAQQVVPPMEFPGGRFALLRDPQGATFGLLKTAPR